jgi:hypothetical protein
MHFAFIRSGGAKLFKADPPDRQGDAALVSHHLTTLLLRTDPRAAMEKVAGSIYAR